MRWLLVLLVCVTLGGSVLAHPHPEHPHEQENAQIVIDTEQKALVKDWRYCNPAGFPTRWDKHIRNAVRKHWPLDWQHLHCEWRAQLAKESSLNADRTCNRPNHAGAQCLAQLLPGTAKEIEKATGLTMTRTNAIAAIFAGAWYMRAQSNGWLGEARAASPCRMDLSRAGYISGRGHIYRGQRKAREDGEPAQCFEGIAPYLPLVISEANAADVVEYINTIRKLSKAMTPGL